MSWLPEETESVIVSSQAFDLPGSDFPERSSFDWTFRGLQIISAGMAYLNDGPWYVPDQEVSFSVLGLRDFHLPDGMEVSSFTKVSIVRFKQQFDLPSTAAGMAGSWEEVRLEEHPREWIFAFQSGSSEPLGYLHLDSDTLVYCDELSDLQRILDRRAGREPGGGPFPPGDRIRAQVMEDAPLWAIRRYDPADGSLDPTSPLSGGQDFPYGKLFAHLDDAATGCTFWLLPEDESFIVRYLTEATEGANGMTERLREHSGNLVSSKEISEGVFQLSLSGDGEALFFIGLGLVGKGVFP